MRKLALIALVATAGCSAAGQPGSETVDGRGQAVTPQGAGSGIAPNTGKTPKIRNVTPGQSSSGSSSGGVEAGAPSNTGWQPLTNQAPLSNGQPLYAGFAMLLSDGTVLVQDLGSANWWKLTPDNKGSYLNGTWTQVASPPNGYDPLYFASGLLPDGRVVVEGGEYQGQAGNFNADWGTQGAIYDPVANQWTAIAPPAGWQTIGDAQSVVLADGRFYLADCCTTNAAVLDPTTLTWTTFGMTGKADINDEEGWTLLPDGNLLTVDANNTADLLESELFSVKNATWSAAGDTPTKLDDTNADYSGSHEMGPLLLRPDGTILAVGATGHNAVYHVSSGRWSSAPDFPNITGQGQLDTADGPAVLVPSGHALITASPGVYNTPLYIFEFDGLTLKQIGVPPQAPNDSSYNTTFLPLPNGQILFTDMSNDIELYTPPPSDEDSSCSWAPQIDTGRCALESLELGKTYTLSGTQLHGLSSAVAYGDDEQNATNYPLVRVVYRATGHVSYLRTHDFSNMSIAPGAYSTTQFDVPATQETGEAELVVVANGIPSAPIPVSIGR